MMKFAMLKILVIWTQQSLLNLESGSSSEILPQKTSPTAGEVPTAANS